MSNWFSPSDIKHKTQFVLKDIHGYVLPHAGTKHTSEILSHTLRFCPKKKFTKVIILYYPVKREHDIMIKGKKKGKNIIHKYHHEYYVVWKTLQHVLKDFWKIVRDVTFIGFNVRAMSHIDQLRDLHLDIEDTLYVISADFSHFLPLQEAISLENCAAHSIIHRHFHPSCTRVIDIEDSFKALLHIIPDNWSFRWIGRTRSSGNRGVGYLSFLLVEEFNPESDVLPDGMFITVYSGDMVSRECLGQWYNKRTRWSIAHESEFLKEVIDKGNRSSRLTNGRNKSPISHYMITYLYKDNSSKFIRGWHGIKKKAFYLPDVFLEHTFNNGHWITDKDDEWPQHYKFYMHETLDKLHIKSGRGNGKYKQYELYVSHIKTGRV